MGEGLQDGHPIFEFNLPFLFIMFFYSYFLMTWTYGVGAATGLFVPCLMVGSLGGRLVGRYEQTQTIHYLP